MGKHIPINCCKCGRFIGPDGDPDVIQDNDGNWECFYPKCGRCLRKETSIEAKTTTAGAQKLTIELQAGAAGAGEEDLPIPKEPEQTQEGPGGCAE